MDLPEYYKDAPHFRPIGDGPEYRLEIPSAKLDFTGTYSVIATNCHGEAKAIISLQILAKDISKQNIMEKGSIRYGNVETLPVVLKHLKDLRCCDGDSITLECHVEAVPEPIIIWEKDGHVLHSAKDFEMKYNGSRATLSINHVYPEDEGEYVCIASNNIGRSYSSGCVIVDVPEEKDNHLNKQLARPSGLLSSCSTPRSTPRATPNRGCSPIRLSYRNTGIDINAERRRFAAPKFYAIPHNRVCEEGETVRFTAAVAGHPMPWSVWDKDGMIITETARISVKERDDVRCLEIEDVCFEDAGLYRITLENDYGRIESTARLDVIPNSRRSRSRSMRAVSSGGSLGKRFHLSRRIMGPSTRIGGRMALSCGFRGGSAPSRKFYHNGEELLENDRINFVLTDKDTELIIDNVQKSDEGIYTCIAQNEYHLISTSFSISFFNEQSDIPDEVPPFVLEDLPDKIESFEGQTTDFNVNIESFEPYNYFWSRNGEVLLDCDEFQYIDNGNGILTLRLSDTFDLDSGIYSCTVKTRSGSCTTKDCELIVLDECYKPFDIDTFNLQILKNPLPGLGFYGQIITFCARVFPPNALSNWIVCGQQITNDSPGFSLESDSDGTRLLHILGINFEHSGEVQLRTTHPILKENKIIYYTNLAVLPQQQYFNLNQQIIDENPDVPVLITKGPKDCTTLIGGEVKLNVQFGGIPIPKVNWFKAGRLITESSNKIIQTTSTESTLHLTLITADDSGKYTVEVMNEQSNDFAVVSVAVEGPPDPPSGKPSVSTSQHRISVEWCGPPYDGGCMLTGFIIEMQENSSDWFQIATVTDSLSYNVKNITPGSKYRFRIRAENIHGLSAPSLSSDEVSISAANEIINENGETEKTPPKIRQGGEFKERFEILEELGKGRFGVVFKAMEKDTKQILAAKLIKCIKSKDRLKVQEEISIMKSLNHPKLLQLAASFETNREIIMVMEYITGGELFERVVADDFTLTERDCILFLRQICEGVNYMHSQSVVHLDLKPENIMCHTRTSHQIKIIDFGLAQRLNADTPVRVLFGTPEFIAPEIINYEPISFLTDLWSIGVICYVLLSGLSPFMGDSDVDTFANITRADYDFDDEAFEAVSQEAKDFISNLLLHSKESRLTAQECLNSKWLSQYHDENLSNNKICTDKLKKFIIRRKWQKTGNAIRALGRMANLSASRRNSAVSGHGSLPNSPRPSISAGYAASLLNPNIHSHMTSVNEEDTYSSLHTPESTMERKHANKSITLNNRNRDKTQCSERSDSGFSECSSCSGGNNNVSTCSCQSQLMSKSQIILEENELKSESQIGAIPHDILKVKLEEIAQNQKKISIDETELIIKEESDESLKINETQKPLKKICSTKSLENFNIEVPMEHRISTLQRQGSEISSIKETIMKSDFTNTVKMRKKSLENNVTKDKPKVKGKFVPESSTGKVSMLKNRFTSPSPTKSLSTVSRANSNLSEQLLRTTNKSMPRSKNVFDRLACNNKTNAIQQNNTERYNNVQQLQSTSLPSSPISQIRSASSMRISRVRDVTERLSTPKQRISSPIGRREQQNKSDYIKNNNSYSNNNNNNINNNKNNSNNISNKKNTYNNYNNSGLMKKTESETTTSSTRKLNQLGRS